jgi:hypothetical protein
MPLKEDSMRMNRILSATYLSLSLLMSPVLRAESSTLNTNCEQTCNDFCAGVNQLTFANGQLFKQAIQQAIEQTFSETSPSSWSNEINGIKFDEFTLLTNFCTESNAYPICDNLQALSNTFPDLEKFLESNANNIEKILEQINIPNYYILQQILSGQNIPLSTYTSLCGTTPGQTNCATKCTESQPMVSEKAQTPQKIPESSAKISTPQNPTSVQEKGLGEKKK